MNVVNLMRDISIEVKVRSFNCYVSSIFLYSCKTWTLKKILENTIDTFQQSLLRIAVLNIKRPNIATNGTVYAVTGHIPWSHVITRKELSRLGCLFRLSDDTPAKIALQYSPRQMKKPRGRQEATWNCMMKMKLLDMRLEWEAANRLAEDRLTWNNFIELVDVPGGIPTCQLSTLDTLT